MSEDITLDFRFLSPMMVFHNLFIRKNANSLLALELDYTPIKHLNLYSSLVIDEFATFGESSSGVAGSRPSATGILGGVQGNYSIHKGLLYGSVEMAKTDPFLYLRDNGDRHQDPGEYGINFVVALREISAEGILYKEDFMGFKYGNDALVFNAQAGYRQFGTFNASLNIFYMLHGTYDAWTLWQQEDGINGVTQVTAPTTDHDNVGNNHDANADDRNSVSKTLVTGFRGDYLITDFLKAYGQLDYVNIQNPNNILNEAPISDVQLTLGISLQVL
jgi:hypothetical protein